MGRSRVHNVDTLEKEILRLRLKAKDCELKLDKHLDKLKDQFGSMVFQAAFGKKKDKEADKPRFFDSLFSNEHFNDALSNVGDKVINKISQAIDSITSRVFKKSE